MDKVKLRVKRVYGVMRGYAGNKTAEALAKLILPRTTFNNRDVEAMQELGYEIEFQQIKMVEETTPTEVHPE